MQSYYVLSDSKQVELQDKLVFHNVPRKNLELFIHEKRMQDMYKKYSDVCQSFERECDDIDDLLRFFGLKAHRTEGGSLNTEKIKIDFLVRAVMSRV